MIEEEYTIDELIAYIRSIIWQLNNCKEPIDKLVPNEIKRKVREADLRLEEILIALKKYKSENQKPQ